MAALIVSIVLLNFIKTDQTLSIWERRELKQFPDIKTEAFLSGEWWIDFESYALDQFVFRQEFRRLKIWFEESVLRKQDLSGLFSEKNHLFKMLNYKDISELDRFVSYIEHITTAYFHDNRIYYVHIPDKTRYSDREWLIQWETATEAFLKENLQGLSFISISNQLSLEHFYATDTHWRQETLHPVAQSIIEAIGQEIQYDKSEFIKKEYPQFLGVLYGQLPNRKTKETLYYLEHPNFQSYTIHDYEKGNIDMYDPSKLTGMDGYDVFLSGASPLLEIINPHAQTDKELVLFRDSFGSSLLPLLSLQYEKITAIDTRYVPVSYLSKLLDFSPEQDVLFMYSSGIVHQYEALR